MGDKAKSVAINLDAILMQLGQFGKFQLFNYMLIIVPVIFAACNNGNYIFSAGDLEYRCRIPECDPLENPILETDWLVNAMPSSGDPRRCSRYATKNTTEIPDPGGQDVCNPDLFNQSQIIKCEEWVYGQGDSIVKELGLQCQSWKRTLVGTIHSCGLLTALPIVGFVSDRYGRKIALVSSAFFAGVLGLARSFANNYYTFIAFEFLEPTLGSGVYSSAFILGMELVGPKRRVLGATILCMFYSFGAMLLGVFAWLLPYWRTFLRVIYAPSLFFISYFWFTHESVRWLISKGRYESAVKILKKAAKTNGVTLTEKSMESLYSNVESKNLQSESVQADDGADIELTPLRQVIRSPIILTRVLKCSFWWITCTFVYYGLSINAVSLAGNSYLNYILVSTVELPAYLTSFVLLDRIGRKYTLCAAFLTSGAACIAFPFLPADMKWLSTLAYLMGKYCITMAFGSLYVYTSELFPTPLRHSLLSSCSMIGRIGSIVAPQTPLLAEYMPSLPALMFGSCSFISGLLMLTSPETLNIKLPDTIEEAENISKKPVSQRTKIV
ncbi:organic cation transporter protein-like [Arctopsyche grandis]|uniref:organic cation transporter protein-like n=1 Tax=Arctopsyche grandis TaxID=121162 RepID=UPI00406D7271